MSYHSKAPILTPMSEEDRVINLPTFSSPIKMQKNLPKIESEAAYMDQRIIEVQTTAIPDIKAEKTEVEEEEEDQYYHNESSQEDDIQFEPERLKIMESRRRQNAVAAEYLKDINIKLTSEKNKVQSEDIDKQSTKWLINRLENRRIITTPREYQVELFNRAKEKNIIAVLDTGSGKTLIAVLLLRHIIWQELEDRAEGKKKRIAFFLVDSVQLVFQQHAVLRANLSSPMSMFYGNMGCDLWNKKEWERHFAENDIIVCTAEVLRQCLHHSFIKIEDINLLIFDEAHHAKKDHAYARIIKDFYAKQPSDLPRPRIFGMTASPVDARVDVRKAAIELETVLNCQIATAEDPSLLKIANKSEGRSEILASYPALPPRSKTLLYEKMHRCFSINHILTKTLRFSYEASSELGVWCSDQVWIFCLSNDEIKKLIVKSEHQGRHSKIETDTQIVENCRLQIQEAKDIIEHHIFDPPDYCDYRDHSKNLSSKVLLLVRYLRECYERKTTDKCIVFVKERYTARLLSRLFEQDNIKTKWLHSGILIGTRGDDANDLKNTFRDQVVTLMKFREGTLNCLFATSVAEEGLDVPDCNLVIRFDLYSTLIQHIQSRGRARHQNSRYIHFCEIGNQKHLQIITEVRKNEGILRDFCTMLPNDRKLSGNEICLDDILAKEKCNRIFIIPETGALLNYRTSLIVLARFVDHLPNDGEEKLQAEYIITSVGTKFQCEAILPESSPVVGAIGECVSTKQIAKCSAAFETCIELVKGKYLDNNLIPIYSKKILPAMRNARLALGSRKKTSYSMLTKPKLWSANGITGELFVTILYIEDLDVMERPTQPLALLTRKFLPQFPSFLLHIDSDRHSPLCSKLIGSIKIDDDLLQQINTFTLCIFDDIFSKGYESDASKMPYFLAPVVTDLDFKNLDVNLFNIIDWRTIKDVYDHQQKWGKDPWTNPAWKVEPDEYFKDKFIVDPYDGSRKLWSVGVTRDYKPLDPVPPNMAPRCGTRKNNTNIMEYSCSLWAKARARRLLDPNQRVIEARYVSLRRNLLSEYSSQSDHAPRQCFVILEPLKISPLPTKVVAMAYIFPAVIHRLESYLIALEACEILHLDIKPELALEALTKDSNDTKQGDSDKIIFQRGMGNNYERLEFLGDCFLKMATSISLFGLHPENNEFLYHVDRMMMTSNKNLRDNALKLELYKYIRTQSFSRRAWYPEGLVLLRGKPAKIIDSHQLSDKTIADVCEAIIGASLLSYRESNNVDMAVRAVTELVSSKQHTATTFADYYKLYTKPKYQIQKPAQYHLHIASLVEQQHPYKFRYPPLLCSAFMHPSYPRSYNKNIPSYQRLEFLGDALLDMVCVDYLFHNFPDKDPQWLTEHKMVMVSNMFLGALCVKLGFEKHLSVFNASFSEQIKNYTIDINEARDQAEKEAIETGKSAEDCSPKYWTLVRQPPKCLPDMVEAYIAAVFVDSEYNYSEVQKFFEMHIVWFFRDITLYDQLANNHPLTLLSNFLDGNMGCHMWSTKVEDISNIGENKTTILVMVMIHDSVVCHADGESARYAKINASKKALEELDGIGLVEFRNKFNCDCHPQGNLEE